MIKTRLKRSQSPKNQSQMELNFSRPYEEDRNFAKGGRSFYFFDFDDNVAYLTTPILIFDKKTDQPKSISSGTFAQHHKNIGDTGPYKDYYLNFNDKHGSFKHFRDKEYNWLDKIRGKQQTFLTDISSALKKPDLSWKAPSWDYFYHAIHNRRPISIITARGHEKETIKAGIKLMVKEGHLPHNPNYLSIYPVSNPDVRLELGDKELKAMVPELKKSAIRQSVEKALQEYGESPYHRFGMSDDDPKNIELITQEMKSLKRDYPEMSFFVIQTTHDSIIKTEIVKQNVRKGKIKEQSLQLALF